MQPGPDTLAALADAYRALHRDDEAASVLVELLARRSLGGEAQQVWLMAHLQLGEIHERRGEPHEAAKLYEALLAVWKDADTDLPAAREARERLQALEPLPGR